MYICKIDENVTLRSNYACAKPQWYNNNIIVSPQLVVCTQPKGGGGRGGIVVFMSIIHENLAHEKFVQCKMGMIACVHEYYAVKN